MEHKDEEKIYVEETVNQCVISSICMKGARQYMEDFVTVYNGDNLYLGVRSWRRIC